MIHMGVRDENVADRFARQCVHDGLNVVCIGRAGVDDRHLPVPQDVSASAVERKRAGVLCNHPSDQRRNLVDLAVAEVQFPAKRNGDRHIPSHNCAARKHRGGVEERQFAKLPVSGVALSRAAVRPSSTLPALRRAAILLPLPATSGWVAEPVAGSCGTRAPPRRPAGDRRPAAPRGRLDVR